MLSNVPVYSANDVPLVGVELKRKQVVGLYRLSTRNSDVGLNRVDVEWDEIALPVSKTWRAAPSNPFT